MPLHVGCEMRGGRRKHVNTLMFGKIYGFSLLPSVFVRVVVSYHPPQVYLTVAIGLPCDDGVGLE